MNILTIDIETSPAEAYIWSLYPKFIPLSQVIKQSEVICAAWKWLGEDDVEFTSQWSDSEDEMYDRLWHALNDADAVVGYNSARFDTKHINRELWLRGYQPPSPYKNIDLLHTMKKQFNFMTNKLDNITAEIERVRGVGERKMETGGFDLWVKVGKGDIDAQNTMRDYNIQDVITTEELYKDVIAWVPNHPTRNAYVDDESGNLVCRCESTNLQRRGYATTTAGKYRRYHCQDCGAWSRGNKNLLKGDPSREDTNLRNVVS